jgi:hypothetical protein
VQISDAGTAHIHHEARRRQNAHEVYGDAVRNIILGVGFLIVSLTLLLTGVAGGRNWWWAMLFPAFGLLSRGISEYLKSKRMETAATGFSAPSQQSLNQPQTNATLPPIQTNYVGVEAESRYKTGDLVPPSVTEGTTRHLEMNSEGETMTLPKK